ncbi:MAG: hypothetical protein ACQEUZ_12330 [Pseudomonadota bacterium]
MTRSERRPRLPRIGHADRLRLHPTARMLIMAQLVVLSLSLEDEEIVAMLAEAWDLGGRATTWAEAGLTLLLLAAWGLLTLGWVRFARATTRDEDA